MNSAGLQDLLRRRMTIVKAVIALGIWCVFLVIWDRLCVRARHGAESIQNTKNNGHPARRWKKILRSLDALPKARIMTAR